MCDVLTCVALLCFSLLHFTCPTLCPTALISRSACGLLIATGWAEGATLPPPRARCLPKTWQRSLSVSLPGPRYKRSRALKWYITDGGRSCAPVFSRLTLQCHNHHHLSHKRKRARKSANHLFMHLTCEPRPPFAILRPRPGPIGALREKAMSGDHLQRAALNECIIFHTSLGRCLSCQHLSGPLSPSEATGWVFECIFVCTHSRHLWISEYSNQKLLPACTTKSSNGK